VVAAGIRPTGERKNELGHPILCCLLLNGFNDRDYDHLSITCNDHSALHRPNVKLIYWYEAAAEYQLDEVPCSHFPSLAYT
jgi:hypothetical protein